MIFGGIKLGQGIQGCVISPPLGSKNKEEVGKLLISPTLAKKEYDTGIKFLRIDPQRKYGIYPTGEPETFSYDQYKNSYDAMECFKDVENSKFFKITFITQIKFPRIHGKTLDSLPFYIPNDIFLKHVKAFLNLIDGFKLYYSKNYFHGDVHSNNIIYTGTYENPISYKFIDFGFAYTDKNAEKIEHEAQEDLKFLFNCFRELLERSLEKNKNNYYDDIKHILLGKEWNTAENDKKLDIIEKTIFKVINYLLSKKEESPPPVKKSPFLLQKQTLVPKKKLSLEKSPIKKQKTKLTTKLCKPDQIYNPATGRCVLKTGAIGKKILNHQQ
jgi:hypothetical protein